MIAGMGAAACACGGEDRRGSGAIDPASAPERAPTKLTDTPDEKRATHLAATEARLAVS